MYSITLKANILSIQSTPYNLDKADINNVENESLSRRSSRLGFMGL